MTKQKRFFNHFCPIKNTSISHLQKYSELFLSTLEAPLAAITAFQTSWV
jgi:hypothetical protein